MSNAADISEYETTTEINFRLDQSGRTVGDSDLPQLDYRTRAIAGHFEIVSYCDGGTSLDCNNEINVVDDLLLDCELADCSIMPRTFWVDHSFRPRCNMEQMAYDILEYHCPIQQRTTTGTICGAEWWVQIRPFPGKTSRYSLTKKGTNDSQSSPDANNNSSDGESCRDISFHWDKDEDLRILCNGAVYVHPHLSTVTYLTDNYGDSAPTFIAEDYRVNNVTGEWIVPYPTKVTSETWMNEPVSTQTLPLEETSTGSSSAVHASAFISWPKLGKHLCFDGRFLHAAPSDLATKVATNDGAKGNISYDSDNTSLIKKERRSSRYTFLVNMWLHHKPFNVHPFPDSIVDKMSGYTPMVPTTVSNKSPKIRLILDQSNKNDANALIHFRNPLQTVSKVTTVVVESGGSLHIVVENHTQESKRPADCACDTATEGTSNLTVNPTLEIKDRVLQFTWPMGDHSSGESIQASIPIESIHSKALTGENVRVVWHPSSQKHHGMFLVKELDIANTSIDREPDCKRTRFL